VQLRRARESQTSALLQGYAAASAAHHVLTGCIQSAPARPPATVRGVHAARGRRLWLAAAVLLAVVATVTARAVTTRYHDDTLWANALASLGGRSEPFDLDVFLRAGDEILAGRSPYVDPETFEEGQAPYVYPPVLALAVTPLSALPEKVGDTFVPGLLFTLLLIAATVGALFLLGVRDWRCYPIALLYPPTLEAFEYGAIGPLLLLLVAVAWRWRDRVGVAAGATGLVVVLKLVVWPLVVWLASTRRLRTAVLAIVTAEALALIAWSAIGFSGLVDYPRLLRKLERLEAEQSYSAFAVFRAVGLSDPVAEVLALACGIALLTAAWRAARAGDRTTDEQDRRSLTLAVAAGLVVTPILWLHYLVLLLVPIALARPRLSLLWFAPLALTVFELLDWYRGWPRGDDEALASVALVVTFVFVASLRRSVVAVRVQPAAPGARARSVS